MEGSCRLLTRSCCTVPTLATWRCNRITGGTFELKNALWTGAPLLASIGSEAGKLSEQIDKGLDVYRAVDP
jgi:hypothetical protein